MIMGNVGVGRPFAKALADLVEGQTEVRASVLAEQLSGHRPAASAKRIGRRLVDLGWTARIETGGRRVYVAPPAPAEPPLRGPIRMMTAVAPPPENDLRRQGLRLEAAASTLNGLRGRADAARFDEAVEQHGLERDAFRAMLHACTGIPAERIAQWLTL